MDHDPTYCQNLLRNLDYDRYLANLYLAPELRGSAMVLDAFDAELSRIPYLVREPMPGEIRLQWWREVLSGSRTDEAKANPLAVAILDCIKAHSLPVSVFERYLDTRVFDLYQDPMPDLSALEGYLGETRSVFFQLKMNILEPNSGSQIAELCGYAGMVTGISNLCCNLPFHHATRRIYVPTDLLQASGLTPDNWLDGTPDNRHETAITHLLETGIDYCERVRVKLGTGELRRYNSVFLQISMARQLLTKAKSMGKNLFVQQPKISPIRKHWIYWRAMRKNNSGNRQAKLKG